MALNGPLRPAVFLDKDGTLVENVPYNVDPALVRFTPHALQAVRCLADHGFALVIVSNQPGLALGYFDRAAWVRLQAAVTRRLQDEAGVALTAFLACPHAPSPRSMPGCLCRKPAPGMLRQAALSHKLDLARSWMVGDILDDVEAGRRAGCQSILMDVGNETEWQLSPLRTPHHRVPDLLAAARLIVGASTGPASGPSPTAATPCAEAS